MNKITRHCYVNGQRSENISAYDRGFFYGHGVFETMRVYRGEIPLWDWHLKRLVKGAGVLNIPVDRKELQVYLDQILSVSPAHGVVKLLLTAGEGGRGYASPRKIRPNYLLQWMPLPDLPSSERSGISCWVCRQTLADSPILAGIKHLNRLEQVLARAEQSGEQYQEGLMLDNNSAVIEGVSSNLFCWDGERWLTAPIDRCGVKGVMREYFLSHHRVEQRDISLSSLSSMAEIIVCNAVYGIRPVVHIVGHGAWDIGPQTRKWQQDLQDNFPCFD